MMTGLVANASDDYHWLSKSGGVFAATNSPEDNEILFYRRAYDGSLTFVDRYSTGGLGTPIQTQFAGLPDPLASQGSVILSDDKRWLLVTNAGSSELSLFRVYRDRLKLSATVDSGGKFPVSVTVHDDLVYVMNVGGTGNIVGFELDDGTLRKIPNSVRTLNLNGPDVPDTLTTPSQIGFTPEGDKIIVAAKSDEIHVFELNEDGTPSDVPVTSPSGGVLPFSFDFDREGRLFVGEVFGNAPFGVLNAGAVSSYNLLEDDSLQVISKSVDNFQFATCWVVVVGPYLYTTNTENSNLSGYKIAKDGSLSLLTADGIIASPGPDTFPADIATAKTKSRRYLFTTNTLSGTISTFLINKDGSLTLLGSVPGLPVADGAQGIAAY
ncbi:lactonase family protein [Sulfuriflexus mobilis]|uniref:lactonase family protein n=1 Tax=Sulfuriflexus mobilis TaxID=1811807 RepID=UPI001558F95A|nr:3-carboxymuconate cyclase [Sulfuriflexus mobilis]